MSEQHNGFAALGVPTDLCAPLAKAGIVTPTPIQAAVIADALRGRDICGRAPTGSGKTLAFGIPLVAQLQSASNRRPTALVLAPTRELADQIATELRPLARARNHAVATVYGGVGYGPQRKALAAGAELIVACPGRLEDLIATGDVKLDRVTQVVIDEADRMADMGFVPAVRRILARIPQPRQVQLFSATLGGATAKLVAEAQSSPARHEVGPVGPDMTLATHVFWKVERPQRVAAAAAAIRKMGSTIVFCRTRHGADRLVRDLTRAGTSAAAIHGGRSQPQRDKALRSFATGNVTTLVATDVAARGVHVDNVAGIIHLDLPADGDTYVHRSGRTARAGASGTVVTFVEGATIRDAKAIQRAVGINAPIGDVDVQQLAPPLRTAVAATAVAADIRPVTEVTTSRTDPRSRAGVPDPRHAAVLPRPARLRLHLA